MARAEDDLWGDDSDEEADQRELSREGDARKHGFYNAGYRDGMEEGKSKSVQQGFDLGFHQGVAAAFLWGQLSGAVETMQALPADALNADEQLQVAKLAHRVSVPARQALASICSELLRQPLDDSQLAAAGLRVDARAASTPPGGLDGSVLPTALLPLMAEGNEELQTLGITLRTPAVNSEQQAMDTGGG